MKRFEFICGGIQVHPPEGDVVRKGMDVQGERTVNLRIPDISRVMVSYVPDLLLDLLEIAAYVYCGDQRATRGGDRLRNAGADWRREMRFVIPVRPGSAARAWPKGASSSCAPCQGPPACR